jgi:hypothetical protein
MGEWIKKRMAVYLVEVKFKIMPIVLHNWKTGGHIINKTAFFVREAFEKNSVFLLL